MRFRGTRFPAFPLRYVLAWLLISTTAFACSVPVFRYALEQWSADPYEVLIFHKDALDEASQKQLEPYTKDPADGTTATANVHVRLVDLNEELSEEDKIVWESQQLDEGEPALPRMVVRYPKNSSEYKGHPQYFDAWNSDWSEENFQKLLDSPARREIARRLIQGETAVWVLLRCGDREQDDAARETIFAGLKKANETLELPEIEQQDIEDGLVNIDPKLLKVNFTSYELDQDDENEAAFISMLLGSESDLRSLSDQPIAFPIFGRGRVLYGLIGGGISEDMLLRSCTELIGPCTCQVKDDNPGTDLVMNVDWDNLIESTIDLDKELPPLQGLASFSEPVAAEGSTEETPSDRERLAALQKAAGLEEEPKAESDPEEPGDSEAAAVATPASDIAATATTGSGAAAVNADGGDIVIESSAAGAAQPAGDDPSFLRTILAMVAIAVVLLLIGTFFFMRKTGPDA
ncbi:MAG: hypothetical protein CMJ46_16650 [Planctomyces sp.]|nr:hypothetical protein [Planctomyces sp.]